MFSLFLGILFNNLVYSFYNCRNSTYKPYQTYSYPKQKV
nr:MAG TPA: hypothetical protein [Caudoviricetes sp.]